MDDIITLEEFEYDTVVQKPRSLGPTVLFAHGRFPPGLVQRAVASVDAERRAAVFATFRKWLLVGIC